MSGSASYYWDKQQPKLSTVDIQQSRFQMPLTAYFHAEHVFYSSNSEKNPLGHFRIKHSHDWEVLPTHTRHEYLRGQQIEPKWTAFFEMLSYTIK